MVAIWYLTCLKCLFKSSRESLWLCYFLLWIVINYIFSLFNGFILTTFFLCETSEIVSDSFFKDLFFMCKCSICTYNYSQQRSADPTIDVCEPASSGLEPLGELSGLSSQRLCLSKHWPISFRVIVLSIGLFTAYCHLGPQDFYLILTVYTLFVLSLLNELEVLFIFSKT